MKLRIWFYVFSLIGFIVPGAALATPEPACASTLPIYTSPYSNMALFPEDLYWDQNSKKLYFRQGVVYDNPIFYEYSVDNEQLSEIENFPFIEQLEAEKAELIRSADDFAYLSPDGQYRVYASQLEYFNGQGYSNLYALGKTEHDWFLPLRVTVYPFPPPYRVRWSDNSETFLLESDSPYGGMTLFIHVTSYKENFFALRELIVGSLWSQKTIYDMTTDGSQVLLGALNIGYEDGLVLWDVASQKPYYEESELIATNQVIGAAFLPNDLNHILIVNQQGIIRYNLQAKHSEILSTQVNSECAVWATFSPDNQFVAVLRRSEDYQQGGAYGGNLLSVIPISWGK